MLIVEIYELEKNIEKYVDLLEKGKEDEIVLSRNEMVVAKMVLEIKKSSSLLGAGKELYPNCDLSHIDDPSLEEELLKDFES